jgi:hypothetical protein
MELYRIIDPRGNVGVDIAREGANIHWMTNCYPDIVFYANDEGAYNLLKAIKGL